MYRRLGLCVGDFRWCSFVRKKLRGGRDVLRPFPCVPGSQILVENTFSWKKPRGVSVIKKALPCCLRFLSAYQRLYCAVLSSVYVLGTPAMYQLAQLRGGPRVPVFGSISGGLSEPRGSTAPRVSNGGFVGVPPNHPFLDEIFHCKPSILGYPHFWTPQTIFKYVFMGSITTCSEVNIVNMVNMVKPMPLP